jgi:hypothetical protein
VTSSFARDGGRRGPHPSSARVCQHLSWLGHRQRTALHALVQAIGDSPSRDAIDAIRTRLSKLHDSADKAYAAYNEAIELSLNDADVAQYRQRRGEVENTALEAEQEALAAIAAAEAALAPAPVPAAPAGPAPPGGGARMQDSLKPDKLQLDALPVDVTAWKKEFATYFRRSQVHTWPSREDQHNVFLACLSKDLRSKIVGDVGYNVTRDVLRSNPPTGDSLEEILDHVFLEEFPSLIGVWSSLQ